jgi:hypothetical protein
MPNCDLGQVPVGEFQRDQRVRYFPQHVQNEIEGWVRRENNHLVPLGYEPKVISWARMGRYEEGIVSSVVGEVDIVFVKYYPALRKFGWEGTASQATHSRHLIIVEDQAGVAPSEEETVDIWRKYGNEDV